MLSALTLALAVLAAPGPVADTAPLAAVVTHASLRRVEPGLARRLDALLGPRHWVNRHSPCGADPGLDCTHWPEVGMMLWARDYAPTWVEGPGGARKALAALSQSPNRPFDLDRALVEARHPWHAPLAGMRTRPGGPALTWLPLMHEGGNMVTDGERVYTTERLLQDNAVPPMDPDLALRDFRPRERDDVLQRFAAAFEVPADAVVVLPELPGDETGHVDMFLMALDDGALLVPQTTTEGVTHAASGDERRLAIEASAVLDVVAMRLGRAGRRVERLPMLGAQLWSAKPGRRLEPVYVTPTNALLLNVDGHRRVLLPKVRLKRQPHALRALAARYEAAWMAAFKRRGYAAELVDVSRLAVRHGLMRCVTAPLPLAFAPPPHKP